MSRRTARGNRIGLAIVGFALMVAAAAALARGFDLRPELFGAADAPVTDRRLRDFAADHVWFWPALAAAAIVVALLALRWLAVQTRSEAIQTVRLEPDPRQGTTTLPARAVTGALQDDLGDSPYLHRAHATLTGSPARPNVALTVTLEPDADPAAAKHRIHQALDRLRQAMEAEHLTATVHIRTGRRTADRRSLIPTPPG